MIKTWTQETLPTVLSIFPLAGALLLPRGELPLNIFEPRYVAMVEWALATPDRMIGMIQPHGHDADPERVFSVGCAGRINSLHETNDGRYLLTLSGVMRFRVIDELPQQNGFRSVRPDFAPYLDDLAPPQGDQLDRSKMLGLLKEYFQSEGLACNWDQVKNASDDTLITALSMVCPFEVPEKQALLEAVDTQARGAIFLTMLEMAVLVQQGNSDDDHPPYH
jgi:Lon protease-like protein